MPPAFLRAAGAVLLLTQAAAAAPATFTAEPVAVADEKAVFATVESREMVPARVRTGGTIASLAVREGDGVERGQLIATIGDPKLLLQQSALDAQIAALSAQLEQARTDLARTQALFKAGVATKAKLDELTTAASVAANQLKARSAERDVVVQQLTEGQVLAPTGGRVVKVPVTIGTVVMSGETIASIAQQDFVLRLSVPEEHARLLKQGDPVRLDTADLAQGAAANGTITLVYPQIQDGRVIADAHVDGLGDYFVGERVRVWIGGGARSSFVVPASYIVTRFGLDYVRIGAVEVPVQRGLPHPLPNLPDGLEILSGLHPGDVLVQP